MYSKDIGQWWTTYGPDTTRSMLPDATKSHITPNDSHADLHENLRMNLRARRIQLASEGGTCTCRVKAKLFHGLQDVPGHYRFEHLS
jgi:hypothetical protein